MKKLYTTRFALAVLLVLLLVGGIGYGYQLYRQPRQTAAEHSVDSSLDAVSLYNAFSKDEPKADQLYLNKILAVSGVVQDLDTTSGHYAVFLKTDGAGLINCSMLETPDPALMNKMVTIKGRCTGFLLDVLLLDGTFQ